MNRTTASILFGIAIAALPAAAQDNKWDITRIDVSKLPAPADQKDLTFDKDIKPLFQASCMPCHGKGKPRHGLRLDDLEAALKGGDQGKMIVPGDSAKSLLVVAAARIDDKTAMPPKRGPRPGGGPGGPGGPPPGGPGGGPPPSGDGGGPGGPPPGGPGGGPPPGDAGGPGGPPPGPGGPGGPGRGGPPAKPLTAEQVSLVRAWIDQGAK
jgi:hypothetical protein